jgi:hypothetical protein
LVIALCGQHRGTSASARSGCKRGQQEEALGRSRGGFGTKVHVRAEGRGKPLLFVLTGGERHEQTVFEMLMEPGAVRRVGRGRPRIRPERLVGDKGYSTDKVRGYLRRRGIGVVIPYRADQPARSSFDRCTYRERNRIERLVNRPQAVSPRGHPIRKTRLQLSGDAHRGRHRPVALT